MASFYTSSVAGWDTKVIYFNVLLAPRHCVCLSSPLPLSFCCPWIFFLVTLHSFFFSFLFFLFLAWSCRVDRYTDGLQNKKPRGNVVIKSRHWVELFFSSLRFFLMALREKQIGWKHGQGGGQDYLPGQGFFCFFFSFFYFCACVCDNLGMNSLRRWDCFLFLLLRIPSCRSNEYEYMVHR
ncbi:hypothetical protein HDV64DRAFT_123091 [Trichoderma sp. TUCIM 5745]